MVNTAAALLILFLLSTCLVLEYSQTGNIVEAFPQTNSGNNQTKFKIRKIDDDWVVYLRTKNHKSIDLSTKSLKLKFKHALEKGSVISLSLETKNDRKIQIHRVDFVIVLSEFQFTFTPTSVFQSNEVVHSCRLTVQTNVELKTVILIDNPPATAIGRLSFQSKVWGFYQEIKELQDQNQTLVLDVSSLDSFKRTFWNSPMFQPKSLNLDFEPFWKKHGFKIPKWSMYNNKVVYDGANPNARLITLMSQEMSLMYSNILANPMYFTFMEDVNHFRYIGHMIGMAIANALPVDMSFTDDVFKALIEEPEHTILPHIVRGFIYGPDAQKRAQINAFCSGVWKVVPRELLNRFDIEEMGLLITGLSTELINVDFLNMWVKYEQGMSDRTPLIKWFWAYVASLNQQKELDKLWEVITGSPRLASFINNKYGYEFMIVSKSLQKTYNADIDSVSPVGVYVCANEPPLLYIPPYSSEQALQNNFNRIIKPKSAST